MHHISKIWRRILRHWFILNFDPCVLPGQLVSKLKPWSGHAASKTIPSKSMYFGCNQPSWLALSGTCRHPSWLSNSRIFCRISAAGKRYPLNYFLVKRSPLLNVYRTSKESARHENLPLSTMHSLMLDSFDCDESRSQN